MSVVVDRLKVCAIAILLLLVAVSAASVCSAQPTESLPLLTLSEAIEIALKNQPAIEAQLGHVQTGEAKAGQAIGAYLPHLNIGSAYTRIWPVSARTSSTTSLAGLPPGSYIPTGVSTAAESYEQYAATGNLSQLLFDFGKTGAQVGAQKLTTEAARLDLKNVQDQVIFNVKQAYYTVLGAERARHVAAESVEQYGKHLEYARALFESGAKPKFDVTKAQVDLSNAQVNMIKAENGVRQSRAALNNAIGVPQRESYSVQEDFPAARTDEPFEEAVRIALARRPDLLSLQKQKDSARESIKAAQRTHYPTFSGAATGIYVGTAFPLDRGWTAGVNMTLPLFTGFVTSYQVAEARGNLTVATANERNLRQTIVLELEQAYLSLREAAERIQATDVAVRQAKENLELAEERYATGLAIGVEVTDAMAAYANAQLANIGALYDYRVAEARIDKAIGRQSREPAGPSGGLAKRAE